MARKHIPRETEFRVLRRSRRRCAFCFGLNADQSIKSGQVAHVNHDSGDPSEENLVFLCLEHHDAYDSTTSQSKGLTRSELEGYRLELDEFVRSNISGPWLPPSSEVAPVPLQDEAIEFFTATHRTQSIVRALEDGPRSIDALNRHIPPNDLEFTRTILASVVERGWAERLESERFALTQHCRNVLDVLAVLPDSVLEDAWRDVWSPDAA